MSSPNEPDDGFSGGRAVFLSLLLGGCMVVSFVAFLVFITGGRILCVVAPVGLICLVCLAHYVVWGRAMSAATQGEREEAELLERARAAAEDEDRD